MDCFFISAVPGGYLNDANGKNEVLLAAVEFKDVHVQIVPILVHPLVDQPA